MCFVLLVCFGLLVCFVSLFCLVCLATPVGDHALKWDDFLEIYSVFEKYEGLGFRFFSKEEEYAEEGYKWKRGND